MANKSEKSRKIRSISINFCNSHKAFDCKVNGVQFFALNVNQFEKKVSEILNEKPNRKLNKNLFEPDPRPVIATKISTGEKLFFKNRQEAIKELNLTGNEVSFCLNKSQKSTKGFYLEFDNKKEV